MFLARGQSGPARPDTTVVKGSAQLSSAQGGTIKFNVVLLVRGGSPLLSSPLGGRTLKALEMKKKVF